MQNSRIPLGTSILSPFLWLARLLVLVVFAIPGVLIIFVLAWLRVARVRPSRQFARSVLQFPWFAWLWNNSEDGVDGLRGGDSAQKSWADRTIGWSDAKRIFIWSALRNPVDSLRWVPILNPRLDPARVRFVGMDHEPDNGETSWYFAWLAGTAYSCLRWEFRVPPRLVRDLRVFARVWECICYFREALILMRAPIDATPVYVRFWLGTKLHPEDAKGLQPGDARAIRCDFAAQLKRVS